MFSIHLDLGKLTDWVGIFVNALLFSSGIIALFLTNKNVSLLIRQMRSQSSHQIIEAHKTLYMPIAQSDELAQLIAGNHSTKFRQNLLTSMMINQASRIFADLENGIFSEDRKQAFQEDVIGLFSIEVLQARWAEVRRFHRKSFVDFMDASLKEALLRPPSLIGSEIDQPVAPEATTSPTHDTAPETVSGQTNRGQQSEVGATATHGPTETKGKSLA